MAMHKAVQARVLSCYVSSHYNYMKSYSFRSEYLFNKTSLCIRRAQIHSVSSDLFCSLKFVNCLSTRKFSMDINDASKAKFKVPDGLKTKIHPSEVKRFMIDCMTAVGTSRNQATELANVLIAADKRGHFSHGLNRLEMYVKDINSKVCDGNVEPTILKESVSTALVQGNNALGPVVGAFCMQLAIKKAKETGIGWISARGSNHYGIAGWYAMMASDAGLVGMSFTNTSPVVAPTRAKKKAIGTNPLAIAAPANDGDAFVLDMATSAVAVGKIEVQSRKEQPIPEGWAIDSEGQVTTESQKALKGGALMPLGGSEINSGYKGFGLAMMVELFCGLLSGSHYGPNIRSWMSTAAEADLGQGFVSIDPSFFAPGFPDRMSDLMNTCRNLEPVDPRKPVLVAGDPERAHEKKVETENGIDYHINQVNDSYRLAQLLGVEPMKAV